MEPGVRLVQQAARTTVRNLLIPIGIIPLRRCAVGGLRVTIRWRRRLPCHSLLMPALIGGFVAASATPVDR
jgi:hypothetical protein